MKQKAQKQGKDNETVKHKALIQGKDNQNKAQCKTCKILHSDTREGQPNEEMDKTQCTQAMKLEALEQGMDNETKKNIRL